MRRFWQRLTGRPIQFIESLPEPELPYTLTVEPSPVITLHNKAEVQLCVKNARLQELNGRIIIEPPKGWNVDQTEVAVQEVNLEKPLSVPLRLTTGNGRIGAVSGQLRLESQLRDETRPFTAQAPA